MEWNQLESDPGLFTLLLEDFHVKNVQVEEVYDLTTPLEGDVFGLIFLFKWQENGKKSLRRTSRSLAQIDSDIFFAYQVTPNACASHAILSILLNQNSIEIGAKLKEFKEATKELPPRILGLTMGHYSFLYEAHNKHAAFHGKIHLDREKHPIYEDISVAIEEARKLDASSNDSPTKSAASDFAKVTYAMQADEDSFHFVCFLPIKGQLFELDGLKPEPISHGKISNEKLWTKDCFDLIQNRIKDQKDHRYNLMAMVPDKARLIDHKIQTLSANKAIIQTALNRLTEEKPLGSQDKVLTVGKRVTRKTAVDQSLVIDIPQETEVPVEGNQSANSVSKRMTTRSSLRKSSTDSSGVTPNGAMEKTPEVSKSVSPDISQLTKETLTESSQKLAPFDLRTLSAKIEVQRKRLEKSHAEELQKKRQYALEDARRVHNYTPFILEFLKCLSEEQPEVFRDFARSLISPQQNGFCNNSMINSSSGSQRKGSTNNNSASSMLQNWSKKRKKPTTRSNKNSSNSATPVPADDKKLRIEIEID